MYSNLRYKHIPSSGELLAIAFVSRKTFDLFILLVSSSSFHVLHCCLA